MEDAEKVTCDSLIRSLLSLANWDNMLNVFFFYLASLYQYGKLVSGLDKNFKVGVMIYKIES